MNINKNIQTKKDEDPLTIQNLPLDLLNIINRFLIIPREDFNKIDDINEMEEILQNARKKQRSAAPRAECLNRSVVKS